MQIQCRDCRQFGQEVLVGTNLIGDVSLFYQKSEEEIAGKYSTLTCACGRRVIQNDDSEFFILIWLIDLKLCNNNTYN